MEWIWTNYGKLSRNFVGAIRTTTINCRVSFIGLYLVFPRNFRMVFLPHTNTVILLERYCGTITEPGLPVVLCLQVGGWFLKFKWEFVVTGTGCLVLLKFKLSLCWRMLCCKALQRLCSFGIKLSCVNPTSWPAC